MLAKTPIDQRFYNWVCSQDPKARYEWAHKHRCACGRFLREELGLTVNETNNSYRDRCFGFNKDTEAVQVWHMFDRLACDDALWLRKPDWTYGALARRIEQAMPECVE